MAVDPENRRQPRMPVTPSLHQPWKLMLLLIMNLIQETHTHQSLQSKFLKSS